MKKHLILVKHSLPEIVENVPAREWKLSDEGRVRAQRLAERINHYRPEVIVSSIESKAKETAEIIARKHKLEFYIVEACTNMIEAKQRIFRKTNFKHLFVFSLKNQIHLFSGMRLLMTATRALIRLCVPY